MKKKYLILIIASLMMLAGLVWIVWGNITVGLSRITITDNSVPKALDGLRIAHVSDLHNSRLWRKTITLLEEAKPDIICITGDLVDSRQPDFVAAYAFVAEAIRIAPCYYIPGNHEHRFSSEKFIELMDDLRELGVTVLLNENTTFDRNGEKLIIVGYSHGNVSNLPKSEGYRLLLAHHPEKFLDYANEDYDLILCGHAHGGQFRLPIVGGLYAPGQGAFPQYDAGLFRRDDATMIVNRGIGNSGFPIRFANRPEVIVITLNCS